MLQWLAEQRERLSFLVFATTLLELGGLFDMKEAVAGKAIFPARSRPALSVQACQLRDRHRRLRDCDHPSCPDKVDDDSNVNTADRFHQPSKTQHQSILINPIRSTRQTFRPSDSIDPKGEGVQHQLGARGSSSCSSSGYHSLRRSSASRGSALVLRHAHQPRRVRNRWIRVSGRDILGWRAF